MQLFLMVKMASSMDHGRVGPTTTTTNDVAHMAAIQLIPSRVVLDYSVFIYFFDRERAVSWESYNLIGSGSGQYFPISRPRSR